MSCDTELLTTNEVAARFKVKPGTVRQWAREGRVPAHRYSSRLVRYRLAEVLAALESGAVQASPPTA